MESISCPKCGSNDWKSAKLIVLEGTTQTTGDIDGSGTTPSMFSGGLNNFLLADAWFSRKFSLQFDVHLTTTTALVGEIKELMTVQAAKIPEPLEPSPPKTLSFRERIEPGRKKAKRPKIPKKPNPPTKPNEPKEPRWKEIPSETEVSLKEVAKKVQGFLVFFFLVAVIYLEFASNYFDGGYLYSIKSFEDYYGLPNILSVHVDLIPWWGVLLFLMMVLSYPIAFLLKSRIERRRAKKKVIEQLKKSKFNEEKQKHQNSLASYEDEVKHYNESILPDHNKALVEIEEQFKREENRLEKEHQEALDAYKKKLAKEEDQKKHYEKEVENYTAAYRNYEKQKLALWERASVCMRCGLAFMK